MPPLKPAGSAAQPAVIAIVRSSSDTQAIRCGTHWRRLTERRRLRIFLRRSSLVLRALSIGWSSATGCLRKARTLRPRPPTRPPTSMSSGTTSCGAGQTAPCCMISVCHLTLPSARVHMADRGCGTWRGDCINHRSHGIRRTGIGGCHPGMLRNSTIGLSGG